MRLDIIKNNKGVHPLFSIELEKFRIEDNVLLFIYNKIIYKLKIKYINLNVNNAFGNVDVGYFFYFSRQEQEYICKEFNIENINKKLDVISIQIITEFLQGEKYDKQTKVI